MTDDLVGEDRDLVVVDPRSVDRKVDIVGDVEFIVRVPNGPAPTAPAEAPLLSRETETSLVSAFTRLDSTVAQSAPRTLEDLAREMLRPMLKTWLDDNLAPMVERLVQAEIERVARVRR